MRTLTVLVVAVLLSILIPIPIQSVVPQLPDSLPPQPKQVSAGFAVTLLMPTDGLFAGEEMQIEFRVEDTRDAAARRPVRYAMIRGMVTMPSMPAMASFEEVAHREGVPGIFGVHPTFGHGGDYLLTLAVEVPSSISISNPPDAFQVQFALKVSDERDPPKAPARPIVKRFSLRVKPEAVAAAGTPVDLDISVLNNFTPEKTPDGRFNVVVAPVREFEELHEKLLHLFIVRDDLGTFAHEHPNFRDGVFRLQYRFPTPGRYRVFADVAPKHAGSQILGAEINVTGAAPERFNLAKAVAAQPKPVSVVDGTRVEWSWPSPILARMSAPVTLSLRSAEGRPVTDLEPYLGALGHLMLLHEDALTFVHSHPDDRLSTDAGPGTVRFLARFPKPGLYRGWAQFQRAGKVLTTDFVVKVGD